MTLDRIVVDSTSLDEVCAQFIDAKNLLDKIFTTTCFTFENFEAFSREAVEKPANFCKLSTVIVHDLYKGIHFYCVYDIVEIALYISLDGEVVFDKFFGSTFTITVNFSNLLLSKGENL
jgi:hypothetical protein